MLMRVISQGNRPRVSYMVRALRQYGRWLRENYADLEHKEVWQSFVVLAIIMLAFVIYAFTSEGVVYQYAMQLITIVLICYLLWRVETLSDLSISQQQSEMAHVLQSMPQGEKLHYGLVLCNVYKRGIQKVEFTIKKK